MTGPRILAPEGPTTATVAIIGEAAGRNENAQGRPFVGEAGKLLTRLMSEAGLRRQDCWIHNRLPYQPNIKNDLDAVEPAEIERWTLDLQYLLASLPNLQLIVTVGGFALHGLMGHGYESVMKHRGSLYVWRDMLGREIKLMPTVHPAAIMRNPLFIKRARVDWRKIATEIAMGGPATRPVREHFIRPGLDDLQRFYERCESHGRPLAIDIETPKSLSFEAATDKRGRARTKKVYGPRYIACVGFADSPHFSITIPTTEAYWGSRKRLAEAWDYIRALCALPCRKVLQNGLFDSWWLAQPQYDSPITNFWFDTLYMHHALDARDDHDLAYLVSVYTREPYYKDDHKGDDKSKALPTTDESLDRYWTYCGKDAACTYEVQIALWSELAVVKRQSFYEAHYARMLAPLLRMMLGGIRRDDDAAAALRERLTAERRETVARLAEIAGENLYSAKALSTTKLKRYLYETLGLPPQYAKNAKGDRTATTNEVAIRRLALRFPEKVGAAADCILHERRTAKLLEFVSEVASDAGIVRCSFALNTEAGRLKCGTDPSGGGANMQTQPKEPQIRSLYLPDPGHLLLKADLSQAESRAVYMLSRDPNLLALARTKPWEFDTHTRNAQAIFHDGNPNAAVSKDGDERYIGKKTSHAFQRGMRGARLADELLKLGYVRTPEECQRYLDALGTTDRGVADYFRDVRQSLIRDHRLVNSWGRVWDVTAEADMQRYSDELYRSGYSFLPQSEIAEVCNQWGVIPLDTLLQGEPVTLHGETWPAAALRSRLLLQAHDELVISAEPTEVYYLTRFLVWALERPRLYHGEPMTIPVEFGLGRTWNSEVEWKRPPSQEQVELAVVELIGKAAA